MAAHDGGEDPATPLLSELPMASRSNFCCRDVTAVLSPPQPSSDSDLFEFFPCGGGGARSPAEMCAAEDVFSGGKILPFADPLPPPLSISNTHKPDSLPEGLRGRPPVTAAATRPGLRWYLLAFGSTRVPPKMEMSDIRGRQRRRVSGEGPPRETGGGSRGAWKLIGSLSCTGFGSVAVVTAPLRIA